MSDHIAGSRTIFWNGDMKMKIKKVEHNSTFYRSFYLSVPGTGFEPAHPFGCCHLKTVRLPISPPGLKIL